MAEYIATQGGSYHFGNSTCRKRWDQLVAEQVGKNGKALNEPFFVESARVVAGASVVAAMGSDGDVKMEE